MNYLTNSKHNQSLVCVTKLCNIINLNFDLTVNIPMYKLFTKQISSLSRFVKYKEMVVSLMPRLIYIYLNYYKTVYMVFLIVSQYWKHFLKIFTLSIFCKFINKN